MSNELVKLSTGAEISLSIPPSLPAPIIGSLVVATVEELATIGYNIKAAVAEVRYNTQVVISFYEERSRVICEDVIPLVALWAAYQWGIRAIKSMRLEDEQEALADLAKRIEKRRKIF